MFLFYVNPILIAAAVIPAIVLLRFVYKEDRLDKEAPWLLLSLVVFVSYTRYFAWDDRKKRKH